MNKKNDYASEVIQLTFLDVESVRIVEKGKDSSMVVNSALVKNEDGLITVDFFPLIYSDRLAENDNSDLQIKSRAIEYSVASTRKENA